MRSRSIATVSLSLLGAAALYAQQSATLQLQQTFREPFSLVRGVVELSDGRVLVADQREVAVYAADFRTGQRRRIGTGEGAGPHEYKGPVGLFHLNGDTVAIYQGKPGGFLWMNPTLELDTGIERDDLPQDIRRTVANKKTFGSEAEVTAYVFNLRAIADRDAEREDEPESTTTTSSSTTTTSQVSSTTTAPVTTTRPPATTTTNP